MSIVLVGSTSGSCTLQEQAVAGNTVLTLPTTSGTILTTGSSGQSIPKAALPTGSVLQVVSTAKTDTFTTTSNTLTSVTGLTATITPTSSSSKILVLVTMSVGTTYGSTAIMTGLLRGSTNLLLGDAAGTRKQAFMTQTGSNNNFQLCISMAYLDSPATTSSTTYAASIACQEGNSTTVCVNRSGADPDGSYASRTASTITVMEIAA